jgi:hypothetical protein
VTEEEGSGPQPVELRINAKIEQPARSDGYRPITDPLWVWATILGSFPSDGSWRVFVSAARRLDSAHRQIERVRAGIDDLPPMGSPAGRWAMHAVIGDAEMAIWALDKSLDLAVQIQGRYRIPGTFPKIITEKRPIVGALRDHWSHIDERAVGKVNKKKDPTAENAWEYPAIFNDRAFTDGTDSLGVDQESTDLCIATRDYLVRAWQHLVAETHKERYGESEDA